MATILEQCKSLPDARGRVDPRGVLGGLFLLEKNKTLHLRRPARDPSALTPAAQAAEGERLPKKEYLQHVSVGCWCPPYVPVDS